MSMSNQPEKNQTDNIFNLSIITILGQVGCLVFVIIAASLIAGLWLDKLFDTRPLFTLLLMLGSAPLTFLAVLWTVRRLAPRLNHGTKKDSNTHQEV